MALLCERGPRVRQQVDDVAILADDLVEQQLDFAAHGLAQRIVEVGKDHRQRARACETAQVEPLPGEIDRERFGAGILQHAPDLPLERRRIFELPLTREIDQLIVRDAAPEKK